MLNPRVYMPQCLPGAALQQQKATAAKQKKREDSIQAVQIQIYDKYNEMIPNFNTTTFSPISHYFLLFLVIWLLLHLLLLVYCPLPYLKLLYIT